MELLKFTIPLLRSFPTGEKAKHILWDFAYFQYKDKRKHETGAIIKPDGTILKKTNRVFEDKAQFEQYCSELFLVNTKKDVKQLKLAACDASGNLIEASEARIPTQDDLEGAIAASIKGNKRNLSGLYWLHRKAKETIAELTKDALFDTEVFTIEEYPIKICFHVTANETYKYDLFNLISIYMKVIPDVLTGQWDKLINPEFAEGNSIVKVNKGTILGKIKPILIDDDWKHVQSGDIRFSYNPDITEESIKVVIESYTVVSTNIPRFGKTIF